MDMESAELESLSSYLLIALPDIKNIEFIKAIQITIDISKEEQEQ